MKKKPQRITLPDSRNEVGIAPGRLLRLLHYRRQSHTAIVLMVWGFGLLMAAWVMANPVAAAPDEPSHFVKALGASYGQWSGDVPVLPSSESNPRDRLMATVTRTFRIPPRYALGGGHPNGPLSCIISKKVSAACQERPVPSFARGPTVPLPGWWIHRPRIAAPSAGGPQASYVGPYQPFLYLHLGLAARLAGTAVAGLRAARTANALTCLLLLYGAFRSARSRGALTGILLAATPTAIFLASAVTTNGSEVFGSLCFLCAGLALIRGDDRVESWWWLALGGAALALSKATGPPWVAVDAIALVGIAGLRRTLFILHRARRFAIPSVGVVAVATSVSAAWTATKLTETASNVPAHRWDVAVAGHNLTAIVDGAIGLFGWCDTPLPAGLYTVGRLLFGGVVALGIVFGTWRQRSVLLGALAAAAMASTAIVASEPGVCVAGQARYTLAIGLLGPLLACHIIAEREDLLPKAGQQVFACAITAVAGLQLASWYVNAHRYAVGRSGPWLFLGGADWSPPAGWSIWLALVVTGSFLILAGGMLFPRHDLGSPPHGSTDNRRRSSDTKAPGREWNNLSLDPPLASERSDNRSR